MNKLLIYDADCPMCRVYTKGLVIAGALSAEQRSSSNALINKEIVAKLDPVRSRHEIPLVDLDTGETHYGVDAVLTVLEGRWPRFSRFVREMMLFELARRFYAFISYNRRIIVPAVAERQSILDLAPDFNAGYRIVFLVLLYTALLVSHLAAVGHFDPLAMAMLAGQIGLTAAYIGRHSVDTRLANVLDYVGHLGMSILVGGVFKATGAALDIPALLVLGNAVMIWQHVVRLRVMQLPDYLNVLFIGFVWVNG